VLVAAVAPVSGVLMNGTVRAPTPLPARPPVARACPCCISTGDADPVVPYNGSALLGFPSVDASLAAWRAVNGVPPAARPAVTYAP
jgi:poly(3-hydroxybutyrate) depolymerase